MKKKLPDCLSQTSKSKPRLLSKAWPARYLGAFLFMFFVFFQSSQVNAQCINTSAYGTGSVSSADLTPVTISTCNYATEYATVTVNSAGQYVFASSITTDYITITDASNVVVGHGATPYTATIPATGTYRMHITLDALCATGTGCRVSTVAFVPCIGTSPYLSSTIGSSNTSPTTLSTCFFGGDYHTLAVTDAGPYQFVSSVAGDFFTFTDSNNTVIAAGQTPFIANVAVGTKYRLHVFSSATCGTQSSCRAVTAEYLAPMCGTYTINAALAPSATNFQSFTSFMAKLNSVGVSCPVIANVKEGTYTGQLAFNAIAGSSSANSVTFQADPSNTMPVVLTYGPAGSTDNYLINFNAASNIVFDGITLESTGSTYSRIVLFTGACNKISFTNNIFNNIPVATTSTNNATFYYSSIVLDSITLDGNTFNNGSYVFYLFGSSANLSNNLTITNNVANNSYSGFYGYYFKNVNFSGNTVNLASSTTTQYGAYFYGTSSNPNEQFIAEGNYFNMNTTSTMYGIYIGYFVASSTAPSRMVNNMIASNSTTGTGTRYGIYPYACNYLNIFHNSISVLDGSATAGRALYMNTTGTSYGNVDIRNNIISNTGNGYAVEIATAAVTGNYVTSMNYNVFNYTASNATALRYGSTNYATLSDWQTASSKDANSYVGDPIFVSTADLHVLGPIANNVGDNTVGVLVDIDGETRPKAPATVVDIGADEYFAITADIALLSGSLDRDLCYSSSDSVKFDIQNIIGTSVNFVTNPLTLTWSVVGAPNSNGTIVVNTGTLASGATMTIAGSGVDMSQGGITYTLSAYISPNLANESASNDTLSPVSLTVNKLLAATPTLTVINNAADTVELQAFSSFFPSAGFFITEICNFKTGTGAPAGGWPSYLGADDYIEITGAPFSDLGGITLEQWSTSALLNTYTFPSGTMLSANGTAVIAVGSFSGTDSPADNYYFANGSYGFSSSTANGKVLKDGLGNIIDAVGYSGSTSTAYSFPAASNVTSADWSSSLLGGSSSSGIRLEGADNNTGSNWVLSATSAQNPNAINAMVTAPAAPPVNGFSWVLDNNVIDTNTSYVAGPFTNGTYKYVATYNSADCGFIYDTATVIVNIPCTYTANMVDSYGDGWNGALVSFEVNGVQVDSIGTTFANGATATEFPSLPDMDSVVVRLKNAGFYPSEISFSLLNPQGAAMFSHSATTGLSSGDVLGVFYAQCVLPSCPITDIPAVAALTSCGPNPVTFTATGNTNPNGQGYFWMRSSDSAVVAMGNPFTTPPITATETWYAGIGAIDDAVAKHHVVPDVVGTTGGYGNFTNGMFFTALDYMYLDSVTVRANGPLSFVIRISEPVPGTSGGAGAQIMLSDTIVIPAAGDYQVPVDLAFSTGDYFMNMSVIPGSGGGALWRTTAGAVYPYTIPGLVSVTGVNIASPRIYYFFDWVVSEVCVSSLAAAIATYAPVPSTSLPYAEAFNTGLPCNWSTDAVATGADWANLAGFAGSSIDGTNFMMVNDDAAGSTAITVASLVSPVFNAIGYDTLTVEFDQYFRSLGASAGYVDVFDGSAWQTVYTATGASVGTWASPNHQAIDITMYQNANLQVRFRYDDGLAYAWYWSVDNFELGGSLAPCQNVVVNIVTDIYGSETTWSITDTATGNVYASGGPYPDVSPYNAALATHIDTICLPIGQFFEFRLEDSYGDGLFDGTNTGTYTVDIICTWGNNNVTNGSGLFPYGSTTNPPNYDSTVFEVTCAVPCSDPDSLSAMVACTSADLSWVSETGAVSVVQWGPAGFTPGTGTLIYAATSPSTVSNLMPNTSYDFWVLDTCLSGTVSMWAGPYTFMTDSIAAPSNLIGLATCTDAVVSWTSGANVASSTVQWGPAGFTPGTGSFVYNASSPVTLSGLALGTSYDFWVVDSCGTGASAWSGPVTFTTDSLPTINATATLVSSGNTVTYDFTASGTGTIYGWDFGDGGQDTGTAVTHIYTANGTYQVIVAAYNACGISFDTLTAVVQGIGIDEFGIGNIALYPNPNDGYFTITGLTNYGSDATIEVVNMTGAIIYRQKIVANSSESFVIDLRGYAPGVYQVRVSSEKGVGAKPFVLRN